LPVGENATPYPVLEGKVAGLANLVPKPDEDQEYAETYGVVTCATAIAVLLGENATPYPLFAGNVVGLANLVPKPDEDHGYAETYGLLACAMAIW
jgi:hypothetical protein